MTKFGGSGYQATWKELDNNLIGMGAIKILEPSEVTANIYYDALSYLIFLKRKRIRKIK